MKDPRPDIETLKKLMDSYASMPGNPDVAVKDCFFDIMKALQSERGFMLLYDKESRGLKAFAGYNVDTANLFFNEEVSQSIGNKVFEEEKSILTKDAIEDPRFKKTTSIVLAGLRSVLCVPLKAERGLFGLLYADNRMSTGFYKKDDLDYFEACAGKLSEIMVKICPGLQYKPGKSPG
jgi:signal transduction protein with GAF and PtsI domain